MGDPFRARPRQPEPAPEPGAGEAVVTVETSEATATATVDEPTLTPVDDLPSHSKLESMKKAQLQALARARGVEFTADDTRDDLIDALEAHAGR